MWNCLWRSKPRDQSLLGSSLSTILEPEACTVSLCDTLHVRLPNASADSAQFEHDLHHARLGKPSIDRDEAELHELGTCRRGSDFGNAGPSVVRD